MYEGCEKLQYLDSYVTILISGDLWPEKLLRVKEDGFIL